PTCTLFPYTTLFRSILATGRSIGEGLDDARSDTLFLAMPVSSKGTLVQYAGRLHCLGAGKPNYASTITWIPEFGCSPECSRSGRSEEHTSELQSRSD